MFLLCLVRATPARGIPPFATPLTRLLRALGVEREVYDWDDTQ